MNRRELLYAALTAWLAQVQRQIPTPQLKYVVAKPNYTCATVQVLDPNMNVAWEETYFDLPCPINIPGHVIHKAGDHYVRYIFARNPFPRKYSTNVSEGDVEYKTGGGGGSAGCWG